MPAITPPSIELLFEPPPAGGKLKVKGLQNTIEPVLQELSGLDIYQMYKLRIDKQPLRWKVLSITLHTCNWRGRRRGTSNDTIKEVGSSCIKHSDFCVSHNAICSAHKILHNFCFQLVSVGPKKEKSWGKQTASWRTWKSQIYAQMDFDKVLAITRYELNLH